MVNNDTNSKESNVNKQKVDKMDQPLSPLLIMIVPIYGAVFIAICVFPLAGDWLWVEGWVFVIMFVVFMYFYIFTLNKKNPRVLRNRLKTRKEKKMKDENAEKASSSDKWLLPLFGISFFMIFVVADLDHRFNWSGEFPIWLEIVGFVVLGVGLYLFGLAQLQNAYASKVLDIREGQKLIDTGLYAHVRHPLYSGAFGMIIGIPIGLGSWWAIPFGIITVLGLVVRIKYEEEMLIGDLEGYKEYRKRVKYKLIPKIY
jgi:protein-S-isoprenylcysteine O-methyltransferase Ste14